MAKNIYDYNQFLTQHCIALDLPNNALYKVANAMAGNKYSNDGKGSMSTFESMLLYTDKVVRFMLIILMSFFDIRCIMASDFKVPYV